MPHPNFLIFYVESLKASAAFYADLLGREPIEASANFAMFALESGMTLGLWSRRDVEPASAVFSRYDLELHRVGAVGERRVESGETFDRMARERLPIHLRGDERILVRDGASDARQRLTRSQLIGGDGRGVLRH